MTKRSGTRAGIAAFIAVAAFSADLASAPAAAPAYSDTIVFLVRHAEKASAPADDPPLTDAGRQRAAELARILLPEHLTAVFTSQYRRTAETAAPLVASTGLSPAAVFLAADRAAPGGVSPASIRELVDRILDLRGGRILVVGHSNTLPLVIVALGGPALTPISDGDYDDLFVLRIPDGGEARLERRRYGSPSRIGEVAR